MSLLVAICEWATLSLAAILWVLTCSQCSKYAYQIKKVEPTVLVSAWFGIQFGTFDFIL